MFALMQHIVALYKVWGLNEELHKNSYIVVKFYGNISYSNSIYQKDLT